MRYNLHIEDIKEDSFAKGEASGFTKGEASGFTKGVKDALDCPKNSFLNCQLF